MKTFSRTEKLLQNLCSSNINKLLKRTITEMIIYMNLNQSDLKIYY